MRVRRVFTLAAAAAAITLVAPLADAQAAEGKFVYRSASGGYQVITDPEDGRCYTIDASSALNRTSGFAILFDTQDCSGTPRFLPPSGSDLEPSGSVLF